MSYNNTVESLGRSIHQGQEIEEKMSTATAFRIRPAIVLFGDSLTQQGFGVDGSVGWAGLLAASYTRRADVLNRGFSGYNTNHAVHLVPRIFGKLQEGVLFCTVFFGANDAALPGEPQHVPIDQYGENLCGIITAIRERTRSDCPIILMTPPPVHEQTWAAHREIPSSDRTNNVTRSYGNKMKEIAAQYDSCSVVDTWELLHGDSNDDDEDDRGSYLSDGLHLNEKGNRAIFQGLMDLLQTKYPNLAPMSDDDGEGKYGTTGIPLEEKLWKELCEM